MNIDSDDFLKYIAGEDLPPATERRIAGQIDRRPELRALVGLLHPSFDEDDPDIDPQLLAMADRVVEELWDSRIAHVSLVEPRWPTTESPVEANVTWGEGHGESRLILTHHGERVELRGDWPTGIRPLSLLLCDYHYQGEPGSEAAKLRAKAEAKKYRLTCPLPPRLATETAEREAATPGPTVLGLRGDFTPTDSNAPVIDGRDLKVPWFPERDEHSQREVLVAVNHSTGVRHPFLAERDKSFPGMTGRVSEFLPDDNLDDRVSVSIHSLTSEDWPLLSPELASLALAQAVPIPRLLEAIAGGYALAPIDSGPPAEANHPATTWLIRYVVEKRGV
jgi:hypothetical protein